MDTLLESLLEGFFLSFTTKIQAYISDIESKVVSFGTGIGQSVATAIITGLWNDLRGRFILFVFSLWGIYIVRVFVHDMIALYALATTYWRVSMFVGVTFVVLHFVTMKGEGIEIYQDQAEIEVEETICETVGMEATKAGERPRATSYSYWWTTSVRKSDGKVQTTTEETTTLKVSADGKSTELDVRTASKRSDMGGKKKPLKASETKDNELSVALASLKPSKLVPADEESTVQTSTDGRSTFAAGIAPIELEEGLQIRSDLPFPADKPIYFEVRVGIKDPNGWIGIGLCTANSLTTGMPGWFAGSFAYHGDDGTLFLENQKGKSYGPTYGMFDVIGCGVDFERDEMFFTKNGDYLGKASKAPKGDLFAVVGIGYKGARISVNFGETHFHYNP